MSQLSLSASTSKLCFNSRCSNSKPHPPRNGWRLRSGDFAELCDRCAVVYEEGRYCETYHLNARDGDVESCKKRVHCGCIVSASSFTLLDHGGIECVIVQGKMRPWLQIMHGHLPCFTMQLFLRD